MPVGTGRSSDPRLTRREVDLLAEMAPTGSPRGCALGMCLSRFRFGSLPQRRDAAGQYHHVAAMLNAAAAEPLAFVVNISSDAVYADSAAPLSEASVKTPHRCTE